MQVPADLFSKWVILRSEDDTRKIADVAKVNPATIRNAFNWQKCSTKVFEAMAAYYKAKGDLVNSYLNPQPLKESA